MLFFVVSDHRYAERIPVQIGTQVIDYLVKMMMEKELQQVWDTLKLVHLSSIISKQYIVKCLDMSEYDLKGVKGKICTMREVVIPTFGTTIVKGTANFTTHSKCLNVVVEPVAGYSEHIATTRSYVILKPAKGKIDVCLRNHSVKQVTLP